MSVTRVPIAIVGAGPGDVELITVKGRRLLDEAETIVYAGSLVNKKLFAGSSAELHDSSKMNLEEIVDVLSISWKEGKKTVRLHTGDPSIFGAIKEQMVLLDQLEIPYDIIPGVSSGTGSAAALKAELTLPEVTQTVIITRREGRTPVPEKEKLKLLAAHQSTMLIFLSVSMMESVVDELLEGGYLPETPIAVVEKASWPEERIVRGCLDNICEKVEEQEIRKTAMICVGRVFGDDPLEAVSKLYDKEFSHGTRKGKP
ncbi:MAG: precorrin-4 C(11)-methyltransferase [Thermodesulfobacteriota bacterium]